jgi:hypothetical protein
MVAKKLCALAVLVVCVSSGLAADFSELSRLTPGRVRAENGLWIETPLDRQFKSSKTVTIADIKGPGVITMIHFALPHRSIADPQYKMNRDTLIQMFWDDEAEPSVNVPMVDFFCDPMGQRDAVNSALVNKKRGWNGYFPMPFRKSARILLVYQGPEVPGERLWGLMPCYSYVIWRSLEQIPPDEGYFHAQWRQEAVLTGKTDYAALETRGRGKFIGWNITSRIPGAPNCPVDMNEKFYIDGESNPSIEFQGIEDSFGFSWGFPPEGENLFALTGYWPFMKSGAMAYRWFISDAISFDKSLKIAIGYGEKEDPMFRDQYSRPGTEIQFSSTCYWYQTEPHAAFPPMLAAEQRAAAPNDRFWLVKENLPAIAELKARGVQLVMYCGRPNGEVIFVEPGFDAVVTQGYGYAGWPMPVYHCSADEKELAIDLTVPKGATGRLRLYIIDPDSFQGGRRESLTVGGHELGKFGNFQQGKWIETDVTAETTAEGRLPIRAKSLNGNAVISIIEWLKAD